MISLSLRQIKHKPVRILHVIPSSGRGGAELILAEILSALEADPAYEWTLCVLGREETPNAFALLGNRPIYLNRNTT